MAGEKAFFRFAVWATTPDACNVPRPPTAWTTTLENSSKKTSIKTSDEEKPEKIVNAKIMKIMKIQEDTSILVTKCGT